MTLDIVVRPVAAEDLAALERELPRGHPDTHSVRLRQTEVDEGVYAVAWSGDLPLGHAYIRWLPTEPFASHEPPTPTIQDVGVKKEYWSKGVGTRLMDFLEGLAMERGYVRVGLGVGVENARAKRLYLGRGYVDTNWPANMETWTAMNSQGAEIIEGELCIYLYKTLA